jgi:hypothetical protein
MRRARAGCRAGLTRDPDRAIAVMDVLRGGTTCAATGRAESLYDLSPRTVAVLRALPRPVEATIFLYATGFATARAVAERTRAITGLLRELHPAFTRYAGGTLQRRGDRSGSRSPARRGAMQRVRHRRLRDAQGGRVHVGTRSKVVTWEDLVEPELDLDGEPGPALHAWRARRRFLRRS